MNLKTALCCFCSSVPVLIEHSLPMKLPGVKKAKAKTEWSETKALEVMTAISGRSHLTMLCSFDFDQDKALWIPVSVLFVCHTTILRIHCWLCSGITPSGPGAAVIEPKAYFMQFPHFTISSALLKLSLI